MLLQRQRRLSCFGSSVSVFACFVRWVQRWLVAGLVISTVDEASDRSFFCQNESSSTSYTTICLEKPVNGWKMVVLPWAFASKFPSLVSLAKNLRYSTREFNPFWSFYHYNASFENFSPCVQFSVLLQIFGFYNTTPWPYYPEWMLYF